MLHLWIRMSGNARTVQRPSVNRLLSPCLDADSLILPKFFYTRFHAVVSCRIEPGQFDDVSDLSSRSRLIRNETETNSCDVLH